MGNRAPVFIIADLIVAAAGAAAACTQTTRAVMLGPDPDARASTAAVSTARLTIPPGHLPDEGECRIWIPGAPPGQQPRPKSRPCPGIEALAPAGSWILYRPMDNRKLVYVREVDAQQAGLVIHTLVFDIETTRLVREETP